MKTHIVVAHLEPQSFNAELAGISNRTLASAGYDISFSDL
jgi:putative NADPH-quinone reductase